MRVCGVYLWVRVSVCIIFVIQYTCGEGRGSLCVYICSCSMCICVYPVCVWLVHVKGARVCLCVSACVCDVCACFCEVVLYVCCGCEDLWLGCIYVCMCVCPCVCGCGMCVSIYWWYVMCLYGLKNAFKHKTHCRRWLFISMSNCLHFYFFHFFFFNPPTYLGIL